MTEKTLRAWIAENDNEWKKIKTSLMATKAAQIKNYYNQLERLNEQIATRENPLETLARKSKCSIKVETKPNLGLK